LPRSDRLTPRPDRSRSSTALLLTAMSMRW
jgi:hypothetical protein